MEIDSSFVKNLNENDITIQAEDSDTLSETKIKIHPLPIIEMSDHHTRVTMGGSPISPNSPIVGLLFGYEDENTVSIIDAQEIEYSYSSNPNTAFGGGTKDEQEHFLENIQTKIDLHKMVFPTHKVVGWYRVSNSCNPTPNDLFISNGPISKLCESPIFLLLNENANSMDNNMSDVIDADPTHNTKVEEHDNEEEKVRDAVLEEGDDEEAQLPISTFETVVNNIGEAVFVSLEFELETFEPERIAVEKVFKTQPTSSQGGDSSSALDIQLHGLRSSMESMDARIGVLIDFLCKTRDGIIPPNYKLLREVNAVIMNLPVVSPDQELNEQFEKEYTDTLVLSYLSVIAKTTQAIESHAFKFRALQDGSKLMKGRYRYF